jgi:hypothetical protein
MAGLDPSHAREETSTVFYGFLPNQAGAWMGFGVLCTALGSMVDEAL